MIIWKSLTQGAAQVLRFPFSILWVYLGMLFLALPLSLFMRDTLERSLGNSLVREEMLQGFDLKWWGEFEFGAEGLAETFGPVVVGVLPAVSHFEKLLDGALLSIHPSILLTGILFLLFWAFLAGGILDRYARPEQEHSISSFFSQGSEYFFRFVRLLVISIFAYLAVFRFVADPLHRIVEEAVRDVIVERTALIYTLVVYVVVGLLLVLVSMVLDYAKISLVVERRRSVVLAIFRGASFFARNFLSCFGLYLGILLVWLALFLVYALVAPGAGQASGLTILVAFLIGQAYLIARIMIKLWFWASQTLFFQAGQSGVSASSGLEEEAQSGTPAESVGATEDPRV